jgi:7,8-dihydropterin-6-yl-methyl-4-(beta-D-ribofuranosyl)aminobenzene 5'-phosphate synthase
LFSAVTNMSHEFSSEAQSLSVTVVVDNEINIFLPSQGPLAYPQPGPGSSLLAEQGLALWVEASDGRGQTSRLLYDFGRSEKVLSHNLELLGLNSADADYLVLSHGHIDHYGGLLKLLGAKNHGVPLVAHPRAFGVRGVKRPDGGMAGPWRLETKEVSRALHGPILDASRPLQLGPGLWTSGSIARTSHLDQPFKAAVRREGGKWVADDFADDQALFVRLGQRGIVVITGCCHAGMFNTLAAAGDLFPDEPLFALLGGLHLNFLSEADLRQSVGELQDHGLSWVLPMHCTGSLAKHLLREAYGESCPFTTTGMTLRF